MTFGFDQSSTQRIARVVRQVERAGVNGSGLPTGAGTPAAPFWAKLTGEGSTSGAYSWKMQAFTAGSMADASPAVEDTGFSAIEANSTSGLPADTIVRLTFAGLDSGGAPCYLFTAGGSVPPGTLFAVNLSRDGGADGSGSTAVTYTYTATSITTDAPTLGTGLTPDKPRPIGLMAVATKGVGYYDASGNFMLAEAYEVDRTVYCGSGGGG